MRGRIFLGALLVVIATAWALSLSGIPIFPGGIAVWWPSILVAAGLVKLIPPTRPIAASVLILVGGALQVWRLEIVPGLPWAYAAPIGVAIAGVALLVGGSRRRRWHRAHAWRHGCERFDDRGPT